MMAVSVTIEPEFSIIGEAQKLFESSGLRSIGFGELNYDVSADGQRFVVVERVEMKNESIKARVV